MGRLIDADDLDITTITTDDYSGNEVLDIVLKEDVDNAPTVEAIPQSDYEARLKADMVAILEELDGDIERLQLMCDKDDLNNMYQYTAFGMARDKIIEKINKLKEVQEGENGINV